MTLVDFSHPWVARIIDPTWARSPQTRPAWGPVSPHLWRTWNYLSLGQQHHQQQQLKSYSNPTPPFDSAQVSGIIIPQTCLSISHRHRNSSHFVFSITMSGHRFPNPSIPDGVVVSHVGMFVRDFGTLCHVMRKVVSPFPANVVFGIDDVAFASATPLRCRLPNWMVRTTYLCFWIVEPRLVSGKERWKL